MGSYLEDFLDAVSHLPDEIRNGLHQVRESDDQLQETSDYLHKQAKKYIARAKRAMAVSGQDEIAEKLMMQLSKTLEESRAQQSMYSDNKRLIVNKMCEQMHRHMARLDSDVGKFSTELRDKGHNGPNKEPKHNAPQKFKKDGTPRPTPYQRRNSSNKLADFESNIPDPLARSPSLFDPGDDDDPLDHAPSGPMSLYPEADLPIASKSESERPLCGAVPALQSYVIPVDHKVAARTSGPRVHPQQWILASVIKYNPVQQKYYIRDDDPSEEHPKMHTISAQFVIPLPIMVPSVFSKHNEFSKGSLVLAMFPDTTTFYRGQVHSIPSKTKTQEYAVIFDDDEGLKRSVPIKYVLHLPDCYS